MPLGTAFDLPVQTSLDPLPHFNYNVLDIGALVDQRPVLLDSHIPVGWDNQLLPTGFDDPIALEPEVGNWISPSSLQIPTPDLSTWMDQPREWIENANTGQVDNIAQETSLDGNTTLTSAGQAVDTSASTAQGSTPTSSSPSRSSSAGDGLLPIVSCRECNKTVKNLRCHMRKHGARRFSCSEAGCTRQFTLKTDLRRHQRSVHEKQKLTCPHCGTKITARKENLRRHMMNKGCGKGAI